jgi:hypothetical protein
MVSMAGGKFHVVPCPNATTGPIGTLPVCVDEWVMMPSSRVDLWGTFRDQNGNVTTSPRGASATLKMEGLTMGSGDGWPAVAGTFWAATNFLINARWPHQEGNGTLSDARSTGPYRNNQSRRFGVRGSNVAEFWPWITAALTALGILVGLLIKYNWGVHQRINQSSPPTTTGSAPSQQRPPPETR